MQQKTPPHKLSQLYKDLSNRSLPHLTTQTMSGLHKNKNKNRQLAAE
jgi:FMN-dependent NADH-azoreductase